MAVSRISGGDRLAAALTQIARKLDKGDFSLSVGFFKNATYPDGQSVAEVAFWNNYGTKRIPPRPFFTNMVAEKSKEWPGALASLLKRNNYDVSMSLGTLGQGIKEQLQQSIKDTNSPPLAQSTIDAKGFSKPLIHTAVMINSVSFEVKA